MVRLGVGIVVVALVSLPDGGLDDLPVEVRSGLTGGRYCSWGVRALSCVGAELWNL